MYKNHAFIRTASQEPLMTILMMNMPAKLSPKFHNKIGSRMMLTATGTVRAIFTVRSLVNF
jgi:hypothetical protein